MPGGAYRASLRLQGGIASRSFAGMRVEAVEKIARRAAGAATEAGEPAASLAIKNFLAAIDSEDSLFSMLEPLAGPSAEETMGGRVHWGDIVLRFRQAELSGQRGLHFLLLEKMIELLKEAGSQESLEATLCLTLASQDDPNEMRLALWIRLAARGDSAEQAVLRWGLGLAHLQQALLFTSRHLRLRLAQTGS